MKIKVAHFGVLTALALILSYLESLIPITFGVPGVKLGLPNLVIVIALYKLSAKEALLISVARIILMGFLLGNMFSVWYGLAGGLLSLFIMALLKRTNKFSVMGVSALGGVTHNIAQLGLAILIVNTLEIAYYLPVLIISGLVTGLIIGYLSNKLLSLLHNHRIL